jgi:hypothetical protein
MRPTATLTKLRIVIATAIISIVLGIWVGAASANRLRYSSTTWKSQFGFAEISGGFGSFRCSLTLEGSLHSATITKTPEALIGYVTRASIGPCPNGSATVNTSSLPWHVRYESFTGTLPNITGFRTKVFGLELSIRETFGITCTISRTAEHSTGTYTLGAGGVITREDLGGTIPTSCGFSATLAGSGSVTLPGSTTRITVTLI